MRVNKQSENRDECADLEHAGRGWHLRTATPWGLRTGRAVEVTLGEAGAFPSRLGWGGARARQACGRRLAAAGRGRQWASEWETPCCLHPQTAGHSGTRSSSRLLYSPNPPFHPQRCTSGRDPVPTHPPPPGPPWTGPRRPLFPPKALQERARAAGRRGCRHPGALLTAPAGSSLSRRRPWLHKDAACGREAVPGGFSPHKKGRGREQARERKGKETGRQRPALNPLVLWVSAGPSRVRARGRPGEPNQTPRSCEAEAPGRERDPQPHEQARHVVGQSEEGKREEDVKQGPGRL